MIEANGDQRSEGLEAGGRARLNGALATGRAWVGVAANAGSGRGSGRRDVDRLIGALGRRRATGAGGERGVGRLIGERGRRGRRARVAWTIDERADLVEESSNDPSCRCLVAA